MRGIQHELASWLVLIAYALCALTPGEPFLLCLEPGGRIVLEAAAPLGAVPCGDVPCGDAPVSKGDVTKGDVSMRAVSKGDGRDDGACACVDIPIPSWDEHHGHLRAQDVAAVPVALAPPTVVLALAEPPRALPSVPRGDPWPSPGLASVRTVVLRV